MSDVRGLASLVGTSRTLGGFIGESSPEVVAGHVDALGRVLMGDRELAAVSRYQLESQELLRAYRGLAWQLEVVDRELEGCSDRDRQEQLDDRRMRITELLADAKARLRACWDRHSRARRVSRRSEES
jgi:hypothetical protein